ncbi:MAG: phosphoribosylglycinamide formyltransferase [Firmicutes bacterium]|nr:phosphoribosylglycinamide formyltransferase [Alicyclobacillaceae bacterium]MCL6497909.1 phosphoribosylglycinamide formyltransferase [Bacillota bacterium]
MKWGVLVGGQGTNLRALLEAGIEVVVVVSHRQGVGALDIAARWGVPAIVLLPRDYPDRAAYGEALRSILADYRVEAVALAGFLRWLDPKTVAAYKNRILNVHPSLLPAFPGLDGVDQALAGGVRWTGVTVHVVDEGHDTGPIVAQCPVPVAPDDDPSRLAARVHAVEHRLFPAVVKAFDAGLIRVDGRRVEVAGAAGAFPDHFLWGGGEAKQ